MSEKRRIWIILAGILIAIGIIRAIFSPDDTVRKKVLEEAEKEAISTVTYEASEIPTVFSECVYSDGEYAIIKVAYKTSSGFIDGTYFYRVLLNPVIVDSTKYRHSTVYDYDLTDEELEKIKAEWKMD